MRRAQHGLRGVDVLGFGMWGVDSVGCPIWDAIGLKTGMWDANVLGCRHCGLWDLGRTLAQDVQCSTGT